LLQILEQIDQFKLKPDPAKGLVKGVSLIVSIMQKDQVIDWLEKKFYVLLIRVPAMFVFLKAMRYL
jgi:hypothetical protein